MNYSRVSHRVTSAAMTRRCSHCSNDGQDSRTCPACGDGAGTSSGVMLFGVWLTEGSTMMKKSASMSNLAAHLPSSSSVSPNPGSSDGYLSDNTAHFPSLRRGDRKKGVPWTEDEHLRFLIGLQRLGKGEWRGIARDYVTSRTPAQVASHAQKYYLRRSNANRRKRRTSLFDMAAGLEINPRAVREESMPAPARDVDISNFKHSLPPPARVASTSNLMPSLDRSPSIHAKPMEALLQEPPRGNVGNPVPSAGFPFFVPSYLQVPVAFPVPMSVWTHNAVQQVDNKCSETTPHHQVLRSIPPLPKAPINIAKPVDMFQLTGSSSNQKEALSQNLLGETSRHSAFHFNSKLVVN
ncbi:hypothetical protein SAY86_026460 [Trapa natans]|uniref:Uncharacterized protein n=1 Tax=Trapa natans TaxID=22666 RepID=A0AAN7KLM8_TRANT|nr:hypothetical protein SAY86_026460 [Trapa natans]